MRYWLPWIGLVLGLLAFTLGVKRDLSWMTLVGALGVVLHTLDVVLLKKRESYVQHG